MAVAMLGIPLALAVGVPLGAWLGKLSGWRSVFGILSAASLVLMLWIRVNAPDYPGQKAGRRLPLSRVLQTPGVRPVLLVVMLWIMAHYILYTYIAPFVTPAGLASNIDVVLLVFGVAALLSIWITGRLVDRYLRNAVLISLATFAATALVFGVFSQSVMVIYVGTFVWGLTFGGAATLLQTALADTAGEGADVALSMNVVAWNGAIAIAGLFGGVLLDQVGVVSFPWVLLVFLLAGLWIAVRAQAHGFPQGQRQGVAAVMGH